MKILFLGGDRRCLQMIRGESAVKNREVDVIGYEKAALSIGIINRKLEDLKIGIYDVIIFPVNGVKDDNSVTTDFSDEKLILPEDLLINAKDNALIFTGIRTPNLNNMLKIGNKDVIALMEDMTVTVENSIPTVEGIIGDLINNTDRTIYGSNILVFGYGNVGKPLVDKLRYLGANMTVGIIKEEDYETLGDMNINRLYTTNKDRMIENLSCNTVIINTVPSMILNKEYLKYINPYAYILDVSSHPHGIDINSANEMGLRLKIWLGIPSAVAPVTAGEILTKRINTIIGGNGK